MADNLVRANQNLFVHTSHDPVPALLRFPRNLRNLATLAGFPEHLFRIGLSASDVAFFFRKLGIFAASSEPDRIKHFEGITWWEFMEADARSDEFRAYLVTGITRNTVAAHPKLASAYTIASVALRTLLDTARPDLPVDRVLNGPTNEVWIDPWVEFLREQGVQFHPDAELESIEVEGRAITRLRFAPRNLECRRYRARLAALQCLERWKKSGKDADKEAWHAANQALADTGERKTKGRASLWQCEG